VKFFVDNNLPPALAKALHALSDPWDHGVMHLREKIPQDAHDSVWIDFLSQEGGWSVITHDKLNKGLEREALRRAGLIVFFLDKGCSNHQFWDKAHDLVR
jgi:predicted nuclease of predicted toxin-antitoxin system